MGWLAGLCLYKITKKGDLKVNAKKDKESLFDRLPLMDKKRAMKFIIYGLITAILFGIIMMTSRSIAQNAGTWYNMANQDNSMNYWNGVYGYTDYVQRQQEISRIRYWMEFQDVIFMNVARVGVNIALVFVLIGFLGFAVNDNLDPRTRWVSLIIAGVILFIMMFTTFFSSIVVTVS